jgi:ribosomal protein L31E
MAAREAQIPLAIQVSVREPLARAGRGIREMCREVVKRAGKQEAVAVDADVEPAQFSRALAGKGYHLDVEVLPALFLHDPDRLLIQHLCALCGGTFIETPRLTPEQKLERLTKACRESGPIGEALLKLVEES